MKIDYWKWLLIGLLASLGVFCIAMIIEILSR